MLAFESSIK